jgi:hypothetical protein
MFVPHRKHLRASTAGNGDSCTFLYVDDVRTSQETYIRTSTACYPKSFNSLYVDDVHSSQETYLRTWKACYGVSCTFLYVDDVRTSQETHLQASTACYAKSFTFLLFKASASYILRTGKAQQSKSLSITGLLDLVADWTPFHTHCYAENLTEPGTEPRTSGLAARNSDQYITEAAL